MKILVVLNEHKRWAGAIAGFVAVLVLQGKVVVIGRDALELVAQLPVVPRWAFWSCVIACGVSKTILFTATHIIATRKEWQGARNNEPSSVPSAHHEVANQERPTSGSRDEEWAGRVINVSPFRKRDKVTHYKSNE